MRGIAIICDILLRRPIFEESLASLILLCIILETQVLLLDRAQHASLVVRVLLRHVCWSVSLMASLLLEALDAVAEFFLWTLDIQFPSILCLRQRFTKIVIFIGWMHLLDIDKWAHTFNWTLSASIAIIGHHFLLLNLLFFLFFILQKFLKDETRSVTEAYFPFKCCLVLKLFICLPEFVCDSDRPWLPIWFNMVEWLASPWFGIDRVFIGHESCLMELGLRSIEWRVSLSPSGLFKSWGDLDLIDFYSLINSLLDSRFNSIIFIKSCRALLLPFHLWFRHMALIINIRHAFKDHHIVWCIWDSFVNLSSWIILASIEIHSLILRLWSGFLPLLNVFF